MFKVYADMLKSDKQRVKGGQSAKFGFMPIMVVATLGALNADSFCERVLSCVKLVVSDLHVSLKLLDANPANRATGHPSPVPC